jgi:hypothetical protein
MLFLPFSPDEVMEEIGSLLDIQRKEKKPSAWVFTECTAWEDRNRFQVMPVYGKFYHVSAQARRVSENEISSADMEQDLRRLYRKYWSAPQIARRFLIGTGKLLALGILFMAVGLANYGLSAWIGSVPAAAIIIGILLAIVLVPQAVSEIWKWFRKRRDDKTVNYQQTFLQRLWKGSSPHCPKCGKYLGDLPVEEDGSIRCACGFRIERKSGS